MEQIRETMQAVYAASPFATAFLSADRKILWLNEAARLRYPTLLLPQGVTQLLTLEQNEILAEKLRGSRGFTFSLGLSAMELVFLPAPGFWIMQAVAKGDENGDPLDPQGPERMIMAFNSSQRRPLSGILSGAGALARLADVSGDEELQRIARQINLGAYRLLRFTMTMTEYLRFQHGVPPQETACFDLRRTVSAYGAAAAFTTGRVGIPLETSVPDEPVPVRADEQKLLHALSQLVSNSCRFTRPGNRIRLTLERRGESAFLTVADEGLGIAPENLSRVMEPFYSRDPDGLPDAGSGLGLPVAAQIVRAFGGTLAISSESGAGTTVTLRLPLVSDGDLPLSSDIAGEFANELRDRFSVIQVILSDGCGAPRP